MTNATSKADVQSLDGLRGFAFLLVVVAHFSNHYDLPLKGLGKVGVWIFFVLSAFLLTQQMLIHREPLSRERLAVFFSRRALRIVPPYFVALAVFLGFGYLINGNNIIGHLLFIDGAGHFWTVAVEVQFYCLLPLISAGILWLVASTRWAAWIIGVIWGASFLLLPPSWFSVSSTFVLPYVGVFLAGCVTAYLAVFQPRMAMPTANIVFLIAAGTIVVTTPSVWSALVAPVESTHFYLHYPLFAAVGSALVLCCIVPKSWCASFFSALPLRALGRVSFSGYLVHPLALRKTSYLDEMIGFFPSVLVSAALMAALTIALYWSVERPLMARKPRYAGAA